MHAMPGQVAAGMESFMRINHNMSAIKANSTLKRTNSLLDRSMERLSSGYKINRAADNAAGLAITQKMRTQIAGLDQSSQNASDGISVIQTAEGALNEVSAIVQRMRELSVQAANGTNTTNDRAAIQAEINQLSEEINRISTSTEFNTKTLLDGSSDHKSYSDHTSVSLISMSETVEIKEYHMNVIRDGRQAVLAGNAAVDNSDISEDEAGSLIVNGITIEIKEGQTMAEVYDNIRNVCDSVNVKAFFSEGNYNPEEDPEFAGYKPVSAEEGGCLTFVTKEYGSTASLEIYCNNEALRDRLGISVDGAKAQGVDAMVELGEGFRETATVTSNGTVVTVRDVNQFELQFEITPGAAETEFADASLDGDEMEAEPAGSEYEVGVTILDAGPLDLQVGANEGQTMSVAIPRVDVKSLGIQNVNVCTQMGAEAAIAACDAAIVEVSSVRAKLGAYQNRLDHAIANLELTGENMTEAMSRIADTDMAKEMTQYTQQNVLSQAGVAMLSQANERPQNILSLLQS